jgi:hypothetical protein
VCVLCEVWAEAEETVEHGAQPEWSSAWILWQPVLQQAYSL